MRTSHKLTHTRSRQLLLRLLVLTALVGGLAFAALRWGQTSTQAISLDEAKTRLSEAKAQYLASPTKENNAKFDQSLAAYKAAMKAAPVPAPAAQSTSEPFFTEPLHFEVTEPASTVAQRAARPLEKLKPNKNEQNEIPLRGVNTTVTADQDARLQSSQPPSQTAVSPAPLASFDGPDMDDGSVLFGGRFAPPDTNADVGPNHVVVATNGGVRVYNKAGVPQAPLFRLSTLSTFAADNDDDGDPVVLYDPLADRWILSQFGLTITNNRSHEFVYVSQTGDPLGAYFAYDYLLANGRVGDYPHMGVWPDAYYMSTNDFNTSFTAFLGAGLYAFDRGKMLAGDPTALLIGFSTGPTDGGFLPADIDGVVVPPAGTPNLFVEFFATEFGATSDFIRVVELRPNFANPAASTAAVLPDINTVVFDGGFPTASRAAIEQPAPTVAADSLDAIADRLMHRLAYRTLAGGAQSYVLNFTVNVSGTAATSAATYQAGVRWMELRRNAGTGAVTINQEATYAPGAISGATGRNLWMAAVAQDGEGNIGLAASASSTTLIPTAIYTGRLPGDPANTLPQGEVDALSTVTRGVQTGTGSRWGDYSSLSVDPVDECTFWGAFEYVDAPTAAFDWNTRVFSFKVNPNCATAPKGSLGGQATNSATGAPLSGVLVSLAGGPARVTNASGNYSFTSAAPANLPGLAPGTYPATCSRAGFSTATGSVTINANQTATFNCALQGIPLPQFGGLASITGGNGNGLLEADECNTLNLTVINNGAATATGVTGTLSTSTPGVVISQGTNVYGDLAPGASATRPFLVSLAPNFACGTTIVFTFTITSNGAPQTSTFGLTTQPPTAAPYTFTTSAGNAIVPGTTLVPGTATDDASALVTLPFAFEVYGQTFTSVAVDTNGNLQFTTNASDFSNTCPLPGSATDNIGRAIMPHWDDLDLTAGGVFTSTSGTAPNRIFNIEWRGVRFLGTLPVNFEARLFEGQRRFDFIYGATDLNGASASIGVQSSNAPAGSVTSFSCNTASLSSGLAVSFTAPPSVCPTGNGACITIANPAITFTDPLVCTGPGNVVTGSVTVTNPSTTTALVSGQVTIALPPGLFGLPNSCVVSGNATTTACTVTANSVIWTGSVAPSVAGQPANGVTIRYNAQVGDIQTGEQLCTTATASFANANTVTAQGCTTVNCQAPGPGAVFPSGSAVNDQKPGSVLVYNIYTSTAGSTSQNTRISLTNTEPNRAAFVHLFFIDGSTCSLADAFICLTPNQTASFLASDLDPGTTGFMIAVASDRTGCPINFNYLIGDEYVKFTSGHAANLAAESIAAVAGALPACNAGSVTATLAFNGIQYNQLPRVLAVDSLGSRADGNDSLLIINQINGDLRANSTTLRSLFGILYDDAEAGVSFTFRPGTCQFRSIVDNNFPRTTPRFDTIIPSGRTGWMKFSVNSAAETAVAENLRPQLEPILGAIINRNPNAGTNSGAFNQGHNLHKLTSTAGGLLVIPVLPVTCQ